MGVLLRPSARKHPAMIIRALFVYWLMASTAVAKYRNSPIHYIKLKPGSGFDIKSFKSLANIFMQKSENLRERNKSSKGRKISNFIDDKGDKPTSNVNFIQLGNSKTKPYKKKYQTYYQKKNLMDEIKAEEIFRPKINFTSNAKPEMLKYRDVQMNKMPILKKPTKELTRLNRKYAGKVPFHFGYSRKFQDFPGEKSYKSNVRRMPGSSGSTIKWLTLPSNGLPTSLTHFKYPVRISRLSSGKDINSQYYNNFI